MRKKNFVNRVSPDFRRKDLYINFGLKNLKKVRNARIYTTFPDLYIQPISALK